MDILLAVLPSLPLADAHEETIDAAQLVKDLFDKTDNDSSGAVDEQASTTKLLQPK